MRPFVELFNPLGPNPLDSYEIKDNKTDKSDHKTFIIENALNWKIEIEIVDGEPIFIRGVDGWGEQIKSEDISIRRSDE